MVAPTKSCQGQIRFFFFLKYKLKSLFGTNKTAVNIAFRAWKTDWWTRSEVTQISLKTNREKTKIHSRDKNLIKRILAIPDDKKATRKRKLIKAMLKLSGTVEWTKLRL